MSNVIFGMSIDDFLESYLDYEETIPYTVYKAKLTLQKEKISFEYNLDFLTEQNFQYSESYQQMTSNIQRKLRTRFQGFHQKRKIDLLVLQKDDHYYELLSGVEIPTVDFKEGYWRGNYQKISITTIFPPNAENLSAVLLPWNIKRCFKNINKRGFIEMREKYTKKIIEKFDRVTPKWPASSFSSYLWDNFLTYNSWLPDKENDGEFSKEEIEQRVEKLSLLEANLEEEKRKDFEQRLITFQSLYLKEGCFPEEENREKEMIDQLVFLETLYHENKTAMQSSLIKQTLEHFETSYLQEPDKMFDDLSKLINQLKDLDVDPKTQEELENKIAHLILLLYQSQNQDKVLELIDLLPKTYLVKLGNETIPLLQKQHDFDTNILLLSYLQDPTEEKQKELIKKAIDRQE